MLFTKNPGIALPDRVDMKIAAPAELKDGLGLFGRVSVNMAERRAKAKEAADVAVYGAQVAGDIARQAIEQKASLIKGALVCQAAPAFAAIATEMIARYQQATMQLRAVHIEGFTHQIELRNEMTRQMDALAAKGMLTDDELAEAKQAVASFVGSDMASLANAVQRAMAAIDAHTSRATDHIAEITNK